MVDSLRQYFASFRTFSRDARRLIVAGGAFSLPFGILGVAVPIYLTRLGYDAVVIGSIFSIEGGLGVALAIPFGIVADRFGRKRMVALGGLFMASSFLVLIFAASAPLLYLAAVLGGFAGALEFAPLQALLADASTEANRTAVFGMSFFAQSTTTALGSLAASSPDLLLRAGWGLGSAYVPLFGGAGLTLLAAAFTISRLSLRDERRRVGRGLLPRRSMRTISKFFAANMIIGLGAGLVIPILSLWFLLKYGQTESFTGPLYAVGSAVNAFAFLAAPILARKYGMVRTVTALSGSGTLLLLAMATTHSLPLAAVLFLARNATMNMSWPIMASFLMGVVEPEERSSASAVVGVSFRLPFAVSTAFGAAMMAQQYDSPLLVTSALYAIGTVAFYSFFRGAPEAQTASAPQAH